MFLSKFEEYPGHLWSDMDSNQGYAPSMSVKRFRLQVTGLSLPLDEAFLFRIFSEYGNLAGVHTFGDYDSKAIVEYENPASAVAAMKNLDGVALGEEGCPIRITWAKNDMNVPKVKRSKKGKVLSNKEASVFVSFAGMRTDVTVNEEVLRRVFGSFGRISEVAIRLSLIDKLTFVRKGYAFIRYDVNSDGIMAAVNAAKIMHNTVRDNIHFHVEISRILASNMQNLNPRLPENTYEPRHDEFSGIARSNNCQQNHGMTNQQHRAPYFQEQYDTRNEMHYEFHDQIFHNDEFLGVSDRYSPPHEEFPMDPSPSLTVFREMNNFMHIDGKHNAPNLSFLSNHHVNPNMGYQPYHRQQANNVIGLNAGRLNHEHRSDPYAASLNSFSSTTSSISSSLSSAFSY